MLCENGKENIEDKRDSRVIYNCYQVISLELVSMLSGRDKKISSVGASDGASLVSGADTP